MDKPIITYHVLESIDTYVKKSATYIGTYTGDKQLSVDIRIWNNYQGTIDVEDLERFNLVLYFLTAEDNVLLPYISLTINTTKETVSPIIENNTVVFSPIDALQLSGKANTGSDEYTSNYIDLTVSFKADAGAYLKDHDLKSLVLDIVEQ